MQQPAAGIKDAGTYLQQRVPAFTACATAQLLTLVYTFLLQLLKITNQTGMISLQLRHDSSASTAAQILDRKPTKMP
ncbi:hypothetical protein CLOSTMETH_02952 [[Clostridium] methylpentosum DSM 5476]|uniref:Uncharacterized protein n=1 Tax=[Clostridium] methylpentosum DSM 5476 TaxID=537013 RepID=C0EGF9_9FIRM|nr:hypothetical protein CLOSTMETH_02952 [[Clostridium] methylpentosum DSM 5476]